MCLRLLIVDDHPLARRAIRVALAFCQAGEPEVVGEAEDGATAIELAYRLSPDVITMDVNLPDLNGLEVTRVLKGALPLVEVVVVSVDDHQEQREEALKAGAAAFVSKEHLIDELPRWLDALAEDISRGPVGSLYPSGRWCG